MGCVRIEFAMSSDILDGLNEAQRRAVTIAEGPLLIIAGPGSGKTRVITHRIAYLIEEAGVRPWKILAVTFTNKAANEMRQRLFNTSNRDDATPLLSPSIDAGSLTVRTFHSFCSTVLRRFGHHIGLDRGFSIFDTDDQLTLVKAAMEEEGLDPKYFPPRAILGVISRAKSNLKDAQALLLGADNAFEEAAGRVYERYQELLHLNGAVDFDDLLMRTVELFQRSPDTLEYYQQRFEHLLVDEFQDTNVAQYELSKQISGFHKNICVVGDPDQSIYSWRSADVRNILDFKKDYPDARVVNLEINYRSTGKIIKAAKSVIASNRHRPDKDIRASRDEGKPLVVYETYDSEEEAYFAVTQISNLLRRKDFNLADCAVMYRTNAQSRAMEEACLHRGMPYHVVGGIKFYHRAEVRDIIAYLRLINNPGDDVSLQRIINKPRRGIGRKSIDMMQDLGREHESPIYPLLRALRERKKGDLIPYGLPSRLARLLTAFVTLMEELREDAAEMGTVKAAGQAAEGHQLPGVSAGRRRGLGGQVGEREGASTSGGGVRRHGGGGGTDGLPGASGTGGGGGLAGRNGGRHHSDNPASGEGTGVSGSVHHRAARGASTSYTLHGRPGAAGRGAAAILCGNHPLHGPAVSDAGLSSAGVQGRQWHSNPFAILARRPCGVDCGGAADSSQQVRRAELPRLFLRRSERCAETASQVCHRNRQRRIQRRSRAGRGRR